MQLKMIDLDIVLLCLKRALFPVHNSLLFWANFSRFSRFWLDVIWVWCPWWVWLMWWVWSIWSIWWCEDLCSSTNHPLVLFNRIYWWISSAALDKLRLTMCSGVTKSQSLRRRFLRCGGPRSGNKQNKASSRPKNWWVFCVSYFVFFWVGVVLMVSSYRTDSAKRICGSSL